MHRRNLPHWHPPGAIIFVTWRLAGTLPRTHPRFDPANPGARWLVEPEVAHVVMNCLLEGEETRYKLHAFVVMPNHVHVLLTPEIDLSSITRTMKGRSARQANLLLGRTGQTFWCDESFDHWIRHPVQFDRVRQYIEQNPVRAGLVQEAEHWRFSSASHRLKPVSL